MDELYVISGSEINDSIIKSTTIRAKSGRSFFGRISNYLRIQLKMVREISKLDFEASYFLPQTMILPMIFLKLKNKKIFLHMGGRASMSMKFAESKYILTCINIIDKIILYIADYLVVQSNEVIKSLELANYKKKILILPQWIDISRFNIKRKYNDRSNCIGYIGILNREKGVFELIKAIEIFNCTVKESYEFILAGGGNKKEIEAILNQIPISNNNIKLLGWVDHTEIPRIMNDLKLCILPSFSEGVPNVILEAMACGTPVLATCVGGVPDIIVDGETGFIMPNNSPKCIAENLERALDHTNLDKIGYNARKYIESNFSFKNIVIRWKIILSEINDD